jgi:hypothetical protein
MDCSSPCVADNNWASQEPEVRFEVLTSYTFWDMMLCIPVEIYLHSGVTAASLFKHMSDRLFTLKLEVEVHSKMLVPFYKTTLHHIAEDADLYFLSCLQDPS